MIQVRTTEDSRYWRLCADGVTRLFTPEWSDPIPEAAREELLRENPWLESREVEPDPEPKPTVVPDKPVFDEGLEPDIIVCKPSQEAACRAVLGKPVSRQRGKR